MTRHHRANLNSHPAESESENDDAPEHVKDEFRGDPVWEYQVIMSPVDEDR